MRETLGFMSESADDLTSIGNIDAGAPVLVMSEAPSLCGRIEKQPMIARVLNRLYDVLDALRGIDFLGPLALRLYLVPVFWVAGMNKVSGFLSFADCIELQRRVRAGERYSDAAAAVDCSAKSVQRLLIKTGGVKPRNTPRSPLRLSAEEREKISRGLTYGESSRVIAARLDRVASTCRVTSLPLPTLAACTAAS